MLFSPASCSLAQPSPPWMQEISSPPSLPPDCLPRVFCIPTLSSVSPTSPPFGIPGFQEIRPTKARRWGVRERCASISLSAQGQSKNSDPQAPGIAEAFFFEKLEGTGGRGSKAAELESGHYLEGAPGRLIRSECHIQTGGSTGTPCRKVSLGMPCIPHQSARFKSQFPCFQCSLLLMGTLTSSGDGTGG